MATTQGTTPPASQAAADEAPTQPLRAVTGTDRPAVQQPGPAAEQRGPATQTPLTAPRSGRRIPQRNGTTAPQSAPAARQDEATASRAGDGRPRQQKLALPPRPKLVPGARLEPGRARRERHRRADRGDRTDAPANADSSAHAVIVYQR